MPSRYENFLLLADLKAELITTTVCEFCEIYNLKNKIKDKTCFKNPSAPTCKDLIITSQPRAFKHYMVIETGFSDFHKMCVTITLREKCPNTVFFEALLTDLLKAFDCIANDLIIPKLEAYGLEIGGLRLAHSYLINSKQIIKVNEVYSSWKD